MSIPLQRIGLLVIAFVALSTLSKALFPSRPAAPAGFSQPPSSARAMSLSSLLGRAEIVCFGDSLTQRGWGAGWVSHLADVYQRKADITNRGFGGYTTRSGLAAIDLVLPPPAAAAASSGAPPRRFLLTTVFFGANDAASSAAQHVPLAEYTHNLGAIVARAAAVSEHVLVISPPPVDSARWPDRGNGVLREYAAAAAVVVAAAAAAAGGARVGHVDLLPVFLAASEAAGAGGAAAAAAREGGADAAPAAPHWHGWLSDGLHLSPEGERIAAAAVLRALLALSPALAPPRLPLDLPLWKDLDMTSPAAAAAALSPAAIAALRAAPAPPMIGTTEALLALGVHAEP